MQMYTTLQIVSVRLREANYDHGLYMESGMVNCNLELINYELAMGMY